MSDKEKTILIIGTCDTKGEEILFMKNIIESKNVRCMVLDLGLLKDPDPNIKPDITRQQIAKVGGHTVEELIEMAAAGRYEAAVEQLASGAETLCKELVEKGVVDGILAIGGSMGTAITLKALRALPVGFPKMLISTVALSDYVHPTFVKSDIMLVQPISDFWGLNPWAKKDLKRAALALAAVVKEDDPLEEGPWIAISTIGWLQFVPPIKKELEKRGFKVAISHSVSMQGGIMEQLIKQGVIKGMLDLCPFELIHEVAGGTVSSRDRMLAAAEMGIPTIVGPGAMGVFTMSTLDMPRFAAQGRFTVEHNEILGTAMPTTDEMVKAATLMAERLNTSKGPIAVVIPTEGFHHYDMPGKMYDLPEGRKAFSEALCNNLRPDIEQILLNCHINDKEFSDKVIEVALRLFKDIKR